MKNTSLLILSFLSIFFFSCSSGDTKVEVKDISEMHIGTPEEVEAIIEQFILAEEGSTIEMPAGFYEFTSQLIIDNINDLTITGAGIDQTILSFKNLTTGGEGMKVVGNNILLKDFAVYDAPGDGLKTQHCENITFRNINATWTNGDKSKNGTYAIYPVQCKNVVIDGCEASHSRDAGIYVGQSENIIVKNCIAFGNVAGIEIENCDNAEVYDNKAYNNTGGILVFNLPGLIKADASGTKIYNNEIIDNNHENFASTSNNGNPITQIPPGSGVIVLAAKDIEVYNNKILRNKTVGVVIVSYQITQLPYDDSNGWSPYTKNVFVHDNTYERPGALPDVTKELGQLLSMKNAVGKMKTSDIVYDGIFDSAIGDNIESNPMNVCFKEEGMEDLHFSVFTLSENISDITSSVDYAPFMCELEVATDIENLKAR